MEKIKLTWVFAIAVIMAAPGYTQAAIDAPAPGSKPAKVRNIIMMIGDGMGPQQVGLLQTYARRAPNSIYQGRQSNIERLLEHGVLGLANTSPKDSIVADSACSATQLATGHTALNEVIAVGPEGQYLQTIVEQAKAQGKGSGLVSDTRLVHATPAAFAAHRAHRSMQDDIARDMIRIAPDVMLSGGLRRFIPAEVNAKGELYDQLSALTEHSFSISSKRQDNLNLLDQASAKGFTLAFNKAQMLEASSNKLLGLFANSAMMDGISYSATRDDKTRTEPSLTEMASKALEVLARNEQGFFLMIEGGQIDWAGHQNDAGTMLHEMIKFDDALGYVLDWVMQRDDTLLIVTADHETGSFGFSYSISNLPQATNLPNPGFGNIPYQPRFNFAKLDILDRLYAQSLSNKRIWQQFNALPTAQQTPATLATLMGRHHQFTITEAMAARAMQRGNNRYFVAGHPTLDRPEWPATNSLFDAFFVYGDDVHINLMGHVLAEQQNVVWGTGTHTATPVLVMTYGPQHAMQAFKGYLSLAQVGQLAKDLL